MPRKSTPVKVNTEGTGPFKGTIKYEHESYGVVHISKVTGQTKLFGSSLDHHSYVTISISRASNHRHLHHNNFYQEKELIEIAMSHAQFGELLCNFNNGSGIPCTLQHIDMQQIPEAESNSAATKETYLDEFKEDARNVANKLNDLSKKVQEILDKPTVSKAERRELLNLVESAKQEIASNMPFVLESYIEKTEEVEMEAKTEIEAFRSAVINAAGLDAIQKNLLPELKIVSSEGDK